MPNRIIKDSISKSEKVSGLTDFQFRLWVHLITYVDDYGRGDARPAIIRGACFPLRDRMTNKDIEKGIADLAGAGCVGLYKVDGKPYLYFPNWDQHQRVRQKVSKFPSPDECDSDYRSAASRGELPQSAARIQNPNPESESRIQNPNTPGGDDAFELFWSAYPKKVDKQGTKRAFKKVDAAVDILLAALENHRRSAQWNKDGGQFIPNPTTWLNQRRWEAELPGDKTIPKGASGELGTAELEAIQRVMREG